MSVVYENALWYLGRGTGVTALVLLTLAVCLGVLTRSGRAGAGLNRFALADLHRTAGLTAVAFVAVHVVTLLLDPIAQLRLMDVALPFTSAYRPAYLGLGALAVDLLVAVTATSLLRHRLGPRVFRLVHWSTYALWPLAFVHAIGAGTDRATGWFQLVVISCAALVALAATWRLSAGFAGRGERRVERTVPR